MVVTHSTFMRSFLIELLYPGSNWAPPLTWKGHPIVIQDPFIPTIVRLTMYMYSLEFM
jgi:hypothetical protein